MQNKPFIVLFPSVLIIGDKIGVTDEIWAISNLDLNEDLFPYIPNSSVDSGSNELSFPRWDCCWLGGTYDGDVLI